MEKQSIGKFIAVMRKSKGLTQQQLADMVRVSNKTVSKWETEESYPDINLIPVLAEIFEISCDELLKGKIINNHADLELLPDGGKSLKLAQNFSKKAMLLFKSFTLINILIPILGKALLLIMCLAYYELVGVIVDIVLIAIAIVLQIINISFSINKLSIDGEQFSQIDANNKRTIYNLSFVQLSVCFVMLLSYLCILLML